MPTPDQEIEPHALELPDGRIVFFYDYDFTPSFAGSWYDPPEPAEASVEQAWWADGFALGEELTDDELAWLHADEGAYAALVDMLADVDAEAVRPR